MKDNQKGITLVALVITIIVLLILAGITIAALSGENGILNRAAQARYEEQIGQTKDLISMEVYDEATEYYYSKYVEGKATSNTIGAEIKKAILNGTQNEYSGGAYPEATVKMTEQNELVIIPQADKSKRVFASFDDTTGKIGTWSKPGADGLKGSID